MTEYSNVKETLYKIKEVTFWNTIIKNVNKYILEYNIY